MSNLLKSFENHLDIMGQQLWNYDGADDAFDRLLAKLRLLRMQVEVQKSLQTTANTLRRHPASKALPKQQATKAKHLIRFVYRRESRGGPRHKQLRNLHCDALKLCGLSFTTEEIVNMEDAKFELMRKCAAEFLQRRKLSPLLYRPDVEKAVHAKFENPDNDGTYEKFIQDSTTIRLEMHKSNSSVTNGSTTEENQAKTTSMNGKVYLVTREDAQYVLSTEEHFGEAWLTNPERSYNAVDQKSRSFMTIWLTGAMGEELGKRSILMGDEIP